MMQMLKRGGMEVMTDQLREADADNPRGYFEYEPVKKLKEDSSWLRSARGKTVKIVSQLLAELPSSENYAVIWMDRDLEEVLASQGKMLERLGRAGGDLRVLREGFRRHLLQVEALLADRKNFRTLRVHYADVVASPEEQAIRVNEFLGGGLNTEEMRRPSIRRSIEIEKMVKGRHRGVVCSVHRRSRPESYIIDVFVKAVQRAIDKTELHNIA